MSEKDKLGPPPVDALSNTAWSRVERGVFARLDAGETPAALPPPRRTAWWIAVPIGVTVAAAVTVLVTRTPQPHVVSPPIAHVDEPSRVVAGDTESSVSFADAHLTLAPHAAVVMVHEGDAPSVTLDRGATAFEVAPRNGRPAFVVRAADVVVRVVGTRFTVARSDERVEVDVVHGIVDVQYKAQIARVTDGQHWSSDELTTPVETGPSDREKFDHSAALEAKSPKAAIEGYLELARGQSTWAPVALFAAGRLAADKKDPRAKQLLQQYLDRFPSGANAADARRLLGHL